jgi:voltage-gated potassium channel
MNTAPIPRQTLRHTLFEILHKPREGVPYTRLVNYTLLALIVANALAVSLETVKALNAQYRQWFFVFEMFSVAVFALEYVLRVWVCVERPRYEHPVKGRLAYMCKPLLLLDLIVIVTVFTPIDLRFLRVGRLLRLLPLLHLDNYDRAIRALSKSLARKRSLMVSSAVMLLILMYCSGALLYQLEHPGQPTVFSSIPASLWWAITTMTTTGYGDMTPLTSWGKAVAGFVMVCGIALFALPTALLTAAVLDTAAVDDVTCPNCGHKH